MPKCFKLQVPFSVQKFFADLYGQGGRHGMASLPVMMSEQQQECICKHLKNINVGSLTPTQDGDDKDIEKQLQNTCVRGDYINVFIRLNSSNSAIDTIISIAGIQTHCNIAVTGVALTSAAKGTFFQDNNNSSSSSNNNTHYTSSDDSDEETDEDSDGCLYTLC